MTTLNDTPAACCARALATAARGPVTAHGPATWCLPGDPGDPPRTARLSADWLELASGPLVPGPNAGAPLELPEMLLRWNGSLAGNTRFGVNAGFELSLRADVPWHEDMDPAPRLAAGLEGLNHGPALLAGATAEPCVVPPVNQPPVVLAELAAATGWKFHARQDGRCDFPIDDADATRLATARVREDGTVRVSLPVVPWTNLGELPRRALAVLLLRAGAALRLARPVILGDEDAATADLEVIFDPAPGPAELVLALESLAVGAATLLAEARLLRQTQTAKEFLQVEEWASSSEPDMNNHNHQPRKHHGSPAGNPEHHRQ